MRREVRVCSPVRRRYLLPALFACLVLPVSAAQQQPAAAGHGDLDAEVNQLRFDDLQQSLAALPAGAERNLFQGVLDNRTGQLTDSIALLEAALAATRTSAPQRMGMALLTLADDYVKTFRYSDASRVYKELVGGFLNQLPAGEQQDARDDSATVALLVDAPPQTVEWTGKADLPTHRSPIGSFDVTLTVNGIAGPWLLDTGANFSVVSMSFATRRGLKLSAGTAQTMGSSGAENPLHTAVIPELHVGGAVVHNVVVLVLPNENTRIRTGAKTWYQIDAVLGYPVFQSLGAVTFTQSGRFLASASAPRGGAFSRMLLDKLTPLLECETHGRLRPFAFDTGASSTDLYVPYYREFAQDFAGMKPGTTRTGGAGGESTRATYILDNVRLGVAGQTVTLHHIPVFPDALGSTSDHYYGNLGRDLVAGFASFTMDFSRLRFYLGEPIPAKAMKRK